MQVRSLVSIQEIRAAAAALAGVVVRTPLVPFPGADPALLVKPESLQPTGAFKLRGAYAAISTLPAAARERGVVTHSSGNHGLAVAYAAALLEMPGDRGRAGATPPRSRWPPSGALGAEIVISAPNLAARLAATRDLAAQRGDGVHPAVRRPPE